MRVRVFELIYPRRIAEFLHRVSRCNSPVYALRARISARGTIAHKDNKQRRPVAPRLLFLKSPEEKSSVR